MYVQSIETNIQYITRPVYPIIVKNETDKNDNKYVRVIHKADTKKIFTYRTGFVLISSTVALKLTKFKNDGLITYLQHIAIPMNTIKSKIKKSTALVRTCDTTPIKL